MSAPPASVQPCPKGAAGTIRQVRNKRQPDWRGRSKLSLFTDNMIQIKIQWNLTNEFGKVAGYNFSTLKKSFEFYILGMNKWKLKLKKEYPL